MFFYSMEFSLVGGGGDEHWSLNEYEHFAWLRFPTLHSIQNTKNEETVEGEMKWENWNFSI